MQRFLCSIILCGCVSLISIRNNLAADWPQFRFDAGRTAASPEQLPKQLHLQWTRDLPTPQPAFPAEVRLLFDASYEPVVAGETMFVPSMVNDSITALDTQTGKVRWRFFTEGPVRFAPAVWEEKIYAASDDGYLYCLDAQTGKLVWRFRGAPEDRTDRKLLGHQRLISLWPARGGPVVDDGLVYFAAGIWPSDGIFVHAVEAETGRKIWSNTTSNQIPRANMDHGVGQYAGLTPQGYLALVEDRVIVPCGAQLPAFLNRKTGVTGDYMMGWGGRDGLPKGSWFVAAAGKFFTHSGDLYDITRPNDEKFKDPRGREDFKSMLYPGGFTRLQIDPTNKRALGQFREPVITEKAIYYTDVESGVVAYDLTSFEMLERSKIKPSAFRKNDKYPDKWKADLELLWNLSSKLKVHIKSGSRLYLGGPNAVQAVDIPSGDEKPRVSWQSVIDGTPHRMLTANGMLFVVTTTGRIHAFGEKEVERVVSHDASSTTQTVGKDQWTDKAAEILKRTGIANGFAIVLGIEHERLVEELVAQSQLYVIALDTDEDSANSLRQKLNAAGFYGTRASVHVGDPESYPLPPYLASLVVSHNDPNTKIEKRAQTISHIIRPYGGVAYLDTPSDALRTQLESAKPPGAIIKSLDDHLLLVRQGALPESDDWSHDGANAANSGASQDRFLKAPLTMLWYDSSIRWHRKPGSAVVRVAGGRAIVKADDLHAVDVFTGRHIWKTTTTLPANSKSEMVAVADGIYLTGGEKCLVIDPSTGKLKSPIDLPEGTTGTWSNLRVWKNFLVGLAGKHLICIDRHSGALKWKSEFGRTELSTAVGGGKVFCAELLSQRRGETLEKAGTKTRCINIDTGETIWEVAAGWKVQYSDDLDLLVTTGGVFDAKDGRRLRDGIGSPQIAGDQIISGTTDKFVVYDLATGKKNGDEMAWYRRGCTGLRSSCNLVTTRFKANAAYIDLETRDITPLWNIRSACNNNLYPANGILNVPNVTGGCECNYTPTSKAFAPLSVIERVY